MDIALPPSVDSPADARERSHWRLPKGVDRSRAVAARYESATVFLVSFAAYFVVGYVVVVKRSVVVEDAVSRLSHAYFAWHNDPGKLSAIGFVWPPIPTLVYLPVALIKPLATSLIALPLVSAAFAAGLIAVLNRSFVLVKMSSRFRHPLLLLFAFNPMIAFYAMNGMSEIVYLFFLTAALYKFLTWLLEGAPRDLPWAGVLFALGVLSRYEVVVWAVVVAGLVVMELLRRGKGWAEVEGTLIAFATPIVYGLGVWLLLSWLLVGDPFYSIRSQAEASIGSAIPSQVLAPKGGQVTSSGIFGRLLDLNLHLFPLTFVVVCALAGLLLVRSRRFLAFVALGLVTLNMLVTALLFLLTHHEHLLQLRYNMRAMPIAMLGVACIWLILRESKLRLAVWALAIATLAASIPVTSAFMRTYPNQYLEQSFVRAVESGADQEGARTPSLFGTYVAGTAAAEDMARYIGRHIRERNTILADDAVAFEVMLFTGRPDLFLDRIDHGDAAWRRALEAPAQNVGYLLEWDNRADLVFSRYPPMRIDRDMLRPLYHNQRWTLLRVVASPRPEPTR